MATQSKKQSKPIHHTLREFLFALSYWGSWTRSLLFFMLLTMMLALSLGGSNTAIDSSAQHFWLTTLGVTSVLVYSGFFFLYDAVYVSIVRYTPLPYRTDRLALFAAEAVATIAIFCLWLVYEGNIHPTTVYLAVFAAALVLPLRAVVGLLGRKS
jgi:hypothetical protein